MRKVKAVITADIVNSSLLGKGPLNALQRSIEKILNANDIRFGFYRGDSFYAICEAPYAFKTVCLLRTLAIQASKDKAQNGIDIRMAIGIGKIEEPVKNPETARGEAFLLSGREMDRMDKKGPRLSMCSGNVIADTGLAAISRFADFLLIKMTIKQSQVIHGLLRGSTQVDIAGKLHKSQSTVNKHANAANWKELTRLLEIYEKLSNQLVNLK